MSVGHVSLTYVYVSYRGEFPEILIVHPERCDPNVLGELGDLLVGQQGDVANQLVAAIAMNEKNMQQLL